MLTESKEIALKVVEILEDKKALEVVALDIHSLTVIADYFIIASGRSESQVKALYQEVEDKLKKQGIEAKHRDGYQTSRWVALDYGDVIVHIFHHEERGFYSLERLWADGIPLSVDNG
ncbi:MAG TPA: ribosome silencing factor [Clostridia bacterium]|nr:ribosome silencing factor [Clostridia bacterium]